MIRKAPLCRVLRDFEPAFAGGILPVGSALAEAYRVLHWTPDPLWLVLAQNLLLHHVHSRDNIRLPRSIFIGNINPVHQRS